MLPQDKVAITSTLLRSGKYFDFCAPTADMVVIEDIAHALAHMCRFGGHAHRFYSVAEHSVHVSHLVPPELALAGLLHDSPEYVLGDVISPLKRIMPGYRVLERALSPVILGKFGLEFPLPEAVREADLRMLLTEQHQVMCNGDNWGLPVTRPAERQVLFLSPKAATAQFLLRFDELFARPHKELHG